jgi:hypothetical protein
VTSFPNLIASQFLDEKRAPLNTQTGRTATPACGRGGAFVDEHQPGEVEHELFPPPASARAGYVRPLLLGGAQGFFISEICLAKDRLTAVRPSGIPSIQLSGKML